MGWRDVVPRSAIKQAANGGQGTRLGQMKRWLYRLPMRTIRADRFSYLGEARFKGKTIKLSPDEIRQIGRRELASAGAAATRYRDWFVEIDDRKVSTKWLVAVLTGIPVQRFQAYDARRVLIQLGLPPKRVSYAAQPESS
jgi:hypothetical protein